MFSLMYDVCAFIIHGSSIFIPLLVDSLSSSISINNEFDVDVLKDYFGLR